MPQEVNNSSGGQLFADDERWGPLAGRLPHTSFGQGHLFCLIPQTVSGIDQAAIVKFPHDFESAESIASYVAEQWDYRWTAKYGSGNFYPETGEQVPPE